MLRRAGYRSDIVGMAQDLVGREGGVRRLCDLLGSLDVRGAYELTRALEEFANVLPIKQREALSREAAARLQDRSRAAVSNIGACARPPRRRRSPRRIGAIS